MATWSPSISELGFELGISLFREDERVVLICARCGVRVSVLQPLNGTLVHCLCCMTVKGRHCIRGNPDQADGQPRSQTVRIRKTGICKRCGEPRSKDAKLCRVCEGKRRRRINARHRKTNLV